VKEFRKSVYICQSYYQTSSGLVFLEHNVVTMYLLTLFSSSRWGHVLQSPMANNLISVFNTSYAGLQSRRLHQKYWKHWYDCYISGL